MFSKSIRFLLVFVGIVVIGSGFYAASRNLVGVDFNAFVLYQPTRAEPTGKVVVVKIDNESFDYLTQSDFRVLTLSKSIFIDLIGKLRTEGAKAIGLDIVLANPDPREKELADLILERKDVVLAAKLGVGGETEQVLPKDVYPQSHWGMIDVIFDKNIVTKIRPNLNLGNFTVEHFAIALYRNYIGDTNVGEVRDGAYFISPIKSIPLSKDGFAYIPFLRKTSEFPSVSLKQVLTGEYPKDFFRDKVVIVGEYGTLIHDAHFAPIDFGLKVPGMEFHANFVESLFANSPLTPLNTFGNWSIALLLALASFSLILYGKLRWVITYYIFTPIILIIFGWVFYAGIGILVDLYLWFMVGGIVPLIGGTAYRYFVVDSKRRFLSNAFGHYISPEVVSRISSNPESLTLGGEKRELVIFFSDIAGFTTISETLGTDRLFALIGEYLSEMTDILVENNGTLDKYIGDAVMGFYGAPLPIDRPEYWACKTSLEQQKRLLELGKKWESEGIPPVLTRIGINTGEVMVGNIGSQNRFNYTAMGDNVNLASRLEGVNKEYETLICVSSAVAEKAGPEFIFRKLDKIRVKGKNEAIEIYELVGFSKDSTVNLEVIESYEKALEHYFKGEFELAREGFRRFPDDPPASIMAARCISLIAGTTRLKNGVFDMKTK